MKSDILGIPYYLSCELETIEPIFEMKTAQRTNPYSFWYSENELFLWTFPYFLMSKWKKKGGIVGNIELVT